MGLHIILKIVSKGTDGVRIDNNNGWTVVFIMGLFKTLNAYFIIFFLEGGMETNYPCFPRPCLLRPQIDNSWS